MPVSSIYQFIVVELTTKDKSTGTTTSHILTNRIIGGTTTTPVYPIIKSLDSVGVTMGQFVPTSKTNTLTLDDSPNSFGYERRFSDLLVRETIANQDIKVWFLETNSTDIGTLPPTSETAWKGTILNWQARRGGQNTLSINIASINIPAREVGYTIDKVLFPNAPDSSVGVRLPLPIGAGGESKLYLVDAITTPTQQATFAYCCSMGTTFTNPGATLLYAKGTNGYKSIASASSPTTATISNYGTNTTGVALGSGNEWIAPLDLGGVSHLVTGYTIRVSSSAAGDLNISARILSATSTNGSNEVVESSVKRLVSSPGGALPVTELEFWLERPILLDSSKSYYLGVTADNANFEWKAKSGGTVATLLRTTQQGESSYWKAGTAAELTRAIFTVKWSNTTSAVDSRTGYAVNQIKLEKNFNNTFTEFFNNLDLLGSGTGIRDSSSGAITGYASINLDNAWHNTALLLHIWDGTAWTNSLLDSTYSYTYTSSGNPAVLINPYEFRMHKSLAGFISSDTIEEAIAKICKNTATRLVPLVNQLPSDTKRFGLWSWGIPSAPIVRLSDDDCKVLDVFQSNIDSVVNDIEIKYKQSPLYQDFGKSAQTGEVKDYLGSVKVYNGLSDYYTFLLSTSFSTYGKRTLADSNFDFLAAQADAIAMTEYYIRAFSEPPIYVELELPYFRFKTLKLFDCVELLHSELPSYFGSSAKAALPSYNGAFVDILQGEHFRRAEPYRGLIESREIYQDDTEVTKMKIILRLYINDKDPTSRQVP